MKPPQSNSKRPRASSPPVPAAPDPASDSGRQRRPRTDVGAGQAAASGSAGARGPQPALNVQSKTPATAAAGVQPPALTTPLAASRKARRAGQAAARAQVASSSNTTPAAGPSIPEGSGAPATTASTGALNLGDSGQWTKLFGPRPKSDQSQRPKSHEASRATAARARQADVVPSAPATMDRTMDLLQQSREMNAFEVEYCADIVARVMTVHPSQPSPSRIGWSWPARPEADQLTLPRPALYGSTFYLDPAVRDLGGWGDDAEGHDDYA